MGDSPNFPPRRSERTRKRPLHLRNFVIEEFDEPVKKSPRLREQINLHQTTLQNESEGMALEQIEKLIGALSASQQATLEKVESTKNDLTQKLFDIDAKVTQLSTLVNDTCTELTNRMDRLQTPAVNIASTTDATQPNPSVNNEPGAPLTRSASNVSISSVESVEQITRQISQSISSALSSHKRLIPLPKFQGEAEKWPGFIAKFNQTTKRENYTTEDNVTRLEEALEGKAKALVEPLFVHHTNVPRIIERLKSRFGMPEQLVENQLTEIEEFPPIRDDDLGRIVKFADKVMILRNFLEGAECTEYLHSPKLLKDMLAKLPKRDMVAWSGYSMSLRIPTVIEFSDWLMLLADQIYRVCPKDTDEKKKKGRVFHASEGNPTSSCLCDGHHNLDQCEKFIQTPYNEKWEIVKKRSLCFYCLKSGHRIFECKQARLCEIDGCDAKHNTILHNKTYKPLNPQAESFDPNGTMLSCRVQSVKVLFKILPVRISGPKGSVQTFAFLDDGSSVTLMNQEIADRIGASGAKNNLHLRWFGNIGSSEETTVVDVSIAGAFHNAKEFKMTGVHVVKDLKLPNQTLDLDKLHSRFHAMKRLPIQQFKEVTPTVLIGLDNAHLGVARNQQKWSVEGPIVCLTRLGYVVYGPIDYQQRTEEPAKHPLFLTNPVQEDLHEMVKQHFSTEEFGVRNCKTVESREDVRANQILEETTKKVDGRFESGLLWREDVPSLPSNLQMAMKRFESCERKMVKDEAYGKAYKDTMEQYFNKGYAKVLSPEEVRSPKGTVWYLPHFGVMHPHKAKFRLVFDAAATFKGKSLNSELLSGPDYNQPLIKVLALFRERKYAVCADIREMFHQINIRDGDKDAQRFVYRSHPNKPMEICRMEVMTFGSTCSPTTAQYVKNLNATHFAEKHQDAVEAIINKHYVDDYVDCFDTIEDAIRISTDVKMIHRNAGFELRGFISNNQEIFQSLSEERNTTTMKCLEASGITTGDKILGLMWNTMEDCFTFNLKFNKIDQEVVDVIRYPSKREFLSIIMSIFDPFGFLADFVVHMKIVMQKIWKSGIQWDEIIPEIYHPTWSNWLKQLRNVQHFKVSRCLLEDLHKANVVELHTLVDASESAFAAVCYIRVVRSNGTTTVAFIAGKTRNAPLKHLSVPRLELQAALLGVRLSDGFCNLHSFRVDKKFFWSDSKTVLFWIKDEKRRYRQFVANRVSEILESTSPKDWRWVSSQDNASDDATRYSQSPIFNPHSRWINGPQWLVNGEWPTQPKDLLTSEIDDEVLQEKPTPTFLLHVNKSFDFITKYSDWFRLKVHTAWLRRFIKFLQQKDVVTKGGLLSSELKSSEIALCRLAQKEIYLEEYEALRKGKSVSKKSSLYRQSPYLDEEGVMRVMGRIDNAPTLPLFTKRPVILPKTHHLTSLVVQHFHEACAHQFDELVVAEIRRKFWIGGIKTLVKQTKKSCVSCKLFNAKPQQPMMGQIPKERLTPFVRPFSHLGVDYFGPVTVSIGRRREKRWVALFTCLTVRAVHLELSQDLSSDAFILCLKNLMNLRGVPSVIYSDNGSNFVGAKNEIVKCSEFFQKSPIQNEVSKQGIIWKFNHPGDPSAGGCWERLVQSIKRVLKRIMKDASPRVETLRSFLLEAANIVNSRPLTHVSVESIEDEPLTPNSFLMGCPNSIQTPGPIDEKLWCLKKQWRVLNSLKNHFWRKWIMEYLPELTKRSKWFERADPLKVGDLVIVCDDDVATRDWPRGVIAEVFKAKDDQVRGAIVNVKGKMVKRPASKLARIDIGNPTDDEELRGEECRLEHSPLAEITPHNN